MIPKIVHYCWFGKAPFPEKVEYCLRSWEKVLPDFECKLWNEENFDLNSVPFVRDAYEAKKYAFVSDYVRVFALAKEGGFYLDTDIEVVKSLNSLTNNEVVLGTDDQGALTAFMASVPNHPFFRKVLESYEKRNFHLPDGSMNLEVNNLLLQEVLREYGFELRNERQVLDQGIEVFPDDYFHAKSLVSGNLNKTANTYTIHWHTLLWVSSKTKLIRALRLHVFVPVLGENNYQRAVNLLKRVFR